jgi:DNA-binding NarL/FixJ family response regulator
MNALRKSELVGTRMSPSCRRDDAAICFVGSGQQFSETVLRTVDAEITPARCLRLSDIESVRNEMQPDGRFDGVGHLCTLVADETYAEALIALAQEQNAQFSRVKFVIAYEDEAFGRALMARHGLQIISKQISVLPMNVNLTTWLLILRMVVSGGHYIPPVLARCRPSNPLLPGMTGADGGPGITSETGERPVTGLTPRETEVLGMLASGQANKIIANQLNLSEHTVKLHIHRIIGKLGVSNRTEAAIWFHRNGGA